MGWTRLIRFEASDKKVYLGQPCDEELDVGLAILEGKTVQVYEIHAKSVTDPEAVVTSNILTVSKLLSPLSKDEVSGGIRCIGLQYHDHAVSEKSEKPHKCANCGVFVQSVVEEMNLEIPKVPALFYKPRNALNDPNGTIKIPASAGHEIDYEVELVIVIGKDCKDVTEEEAIDYILGYTVGNDVRSDEVCARQHQKTSTQWCFCKSFDGFAPIGPCIVNSSVLPDAHVVSLKTQINDGPLLQDGKGKDAIFTFAQIVSYVSQGTTLEAGSIIFSGTPSGIGASRKPPIFLKHGDICKCHISHGLGTLVSHYEFPQP